MFFAWLGCTGLAGYIFGRTPIRVFPRRSCPPPPPPEVISVTPHCEKESAVAPETSAFPENGYTYEELNRLWKCSRAKANFTEANKRLIPKGGKLEKTRWRSVLSVDPKAFFDKYLSQYPGDMAAVQPVLIFSHRPLDSLAKASTVCKVLDVAVIPDVPGVCVAVTETFHDVASYHMLHADKQPDGSFALTANPLEGRDIPLESHYAASRAVLLEYFEHHKTVSAKAAGAPKFGKAAVGCLVENADEVILFRNAIASAVKSKVPKQKFCVFTTVAAIKDSFVELGIKVIHFPELATFGLTGEANVGPMMRRHFLQAWFAFATADAGLKMIWQSPGTVWLDKPDYMLDEMPLAETLWAYKGRADKRASPFYCSTDLFLHGKEERAIHLLHELMLHFDLVLAWGSLDAVASYRLSENNSR